MTGGYAGVVLAGGGGRRLGGASKPVLRVGGARLIDVAVAALAGAAPVVVVGPELPGTGPVIWARESPPGGGPVAALAAAAVRLPPGDGIVVVLAADLPFVSAAAVGTLVAALGAAGEACTAAVAVDDGDRHQPLLAAYRLAPLRQALPAQPAGASLRSVLHRLPGLLAVRLDGLPPPWWDCDTPAELAAASQQAATQSALPSA